MNARARLNYINFNQLRSFYAVAREMSRIEAEISGSIGEEALANLKDLLAAHWGDEEQAGDGETDDNAFDKNSRRVAPLHSVLRAAMGSQRRG